MHSLTHFKKLVLEQTDCVKSSIEELATDSKSLANLAGRVLAKDISATADLPSVTLSKMDGYCLYHSDYQEFESMGLPISGSSWPQESPSTLRKGAAWRVATGAPLPHSEPEQETVFVLIEHADLINDSTYVKLKKDTASTVDMAQMFPGSWRREQGSEARIGDLLLYAGTPMTAAHLAMLSGLRFAAVKVWQKPKVAILSTGNEFVPSSPIKAGLGGDFNGPFLAQALRNLGACVTQEPAVADELDSLKDKLFNAAKNSDMIITTGGVSAGPRDFVPTAIDSLGEIHAHKVEIRPGYPTLVGSLHTDGLPTPVIALPGNPLAVVVLTGLLIAPMLRKILRQTPEKQGHKCRLLTPIKNEGIRPWMVMGQLNAEESSFSISERQQNSGMMSLMGHVNAALLVEPNTELITGTEVKIQPFSDWFSL